MPQPPKILFIVTKTIVGGAQKFITDQIKMLHAEGFELYLAAADHGYLTQQVKPYLQDAFIHQGIQSKTSIKHLFQLKNYLQKNHIDLVICNSANGGLYGRLAAFLAGKKSIYVSHGWSSIYNGGKFSLVLNRVETLLAYLGHKVLCISENDAYLAKKIIKVPKNKIAFIPNQIYPIETPVKRSKKEVYKILFLGRLSHPKKPELLMQAAKNLPQVEVYIVGTGEEDAFYQNLKDREQLNNVHLLGEVPNFKDFNHYDIFSLISLSEGLPMSVLEAMSCGMPLLLSNIKGHQPLIDENGALCENHPKSIKENLLKVIENIETYSENSIKMFQEKYHMEQNKHWYISLYQSIINS